MSPHETHLTDLDPQITMLRRMQKNPRLVLKPNVQRYLATNLVMIEQDRENVLDEIRSSNSSQNQHR